VIDDEKSDDDAKAKAKAILAAMDGDEDKKEEPPAAAKAEGEPPAKEPDSDGAKASATVASLATRVDRMERASLFAARPDLSDKQRADLATVPTSALQGALAAIPRASAKPAATAVVNATRGEGQDGNGRMTLEQANAALGIKSGPAGIRREGLATIYPALTPAEARAHLATKNGGAR
jgi:hypothetical protein